MGLSDKREKGVSNIGNIGYTLIIWDRTFCRKGYSVGIPTLEVLNWHGYLGNIGDTVISLIGET